MAENESKYYYDLTPDAQDIDDALIDLTKILKKLEYGKAVILKAPDDEVLRSHFDLGDASKAIPGDEDVLIAADGNGNAKINEGNFYSKNNNDVATLQTSKSSIEIKGIQTGTEKYWSYGHGLKFHMDGESLLQMISQNSGSPILSMRGRSIVDIDSVYYSDPNPITAKRTNEAFWLSPAAGVYYNNVSSSLISGKKLCNDNIIYPLIQIKESSTVLMEGSPLVHICGGASLLMDGNADVRIRGAGYNKGTAYGGAGRTFFIVDPGSGFYMQTFCDFSKNTIQPQYRPLFQMITSGVDKSQITLSCQGPVQTSNSPHFSHDPHRYFIPSTGVDGLGFETRGFIRRKIFGIGSTSYISDLSNIQAPTFVVQGKTHITLGDTGTIGARISTSGNLHFSWSSCGNEQIKIGSGENSNVKWDISCGSNVNQYVKFGTNSDGNTAIAIEPKGDTSFKFNPENICGISFTPKYTDIVCQWENLEGILEPIDGYVQVEGNSHFESWDDAKVIMRGANVNVLAPDKYTNGPRVDITGTTSTDCTGMTYEQLLEELSNSQKSDLALALKPSFSSIAKMRVTGGSATSTDYYTKRYRAKAGPFSINKKSNKPSSSKYVFQFYSSNSYSNITSVENSTEFKNAVKSRYGENAVVTSVIYARGIVSQGYYYYINADITNIELTFNTATEYPVNTPWSDVSDSDKVGLIQPDDTSQAEVTSIEVRPDMVYNTSISGYTYYTGTHLGEDWCTPVLATDGPVNQMYGSPNLCMRGKFSLGLQGLPTDQTSQIYTGYKITNPIETYDSTKTEEELIAQFIKGQDYAAFETWVQSMISVSLPLRDYYFDHISSFTIENGEVTVGAAFEYKKLGKSQTPHSPTVEIIGDTELRIANGISITTDNVNGESVININAPEGSVSFTMTELKALKALLV